MDGTITPPRQPIQDEMITQLRRLDKHYDIGIVTGSDFGTYNSSVKSFDAIYPAYRARFHVTEQKYDISEGSTAIIKSGRWCTKLT